MVKGLGSANKVIANHAYNAVGSLFSNYLVSFGCLESFFTKNKDHKIAKVREKVAEFIYIFMQGIQDGFNRPLKVENLPLFVKSGE